MGVSCECVMCQQVCINVLSCCKHIIAAIHGHQKVLNIGLAKE